MQAKSLISISSILGGALLTLIAAPGLAVPADPNRPLPAQNCDAAQARLIEAQQGSPLISAEEQAVVLQTALSAVARLCGAGHQDGALPGPGQPPIETKRHAT